MKPTLRKLRNIRIWKKNRSEKPIRKRLSTGTLKAEAAPSVNNDPRQQRYESAFLWSIGTLFLVSFFGTILSLIDLKMNAILLTLWSAVSVCICLVFYYRPKLRRYLAIGGIALILLIIVFGGEIFRDGMGFVFNGIKDLFGLAQSRIYLPYAVSGVYSEVFAVSLFMLPLISALSVIILRLLLTKGNALFITVFVLLIFALALSTHSPDKIYFLLLSLCFMYFMIVRVSGMICNHGFSAMPITAVIVSVVFVLVSVLGISAIGFDRPETLVESESAFWKNIESIRYQDDTTNNLPDGDFKSLGPRLYTDETALQVTISENASLYLRGYVGTVFTEDGWQEISKEDLYKYKNLFYWLHDTGFYGSAQVALAAKAAGMSEKTIDVTVENLNASEKYIYTPYEYDNAEVGDAAFRIGDVSLYPSDYEDPSLVTYTITDNMVRTSAELAKTLDEKAKGGDESVISYLRSENAYREYVYAECLHLPEDTVTILESRLGAVDLEDGHTDYDDAMQSVLNELLINVTYNEEAGYSGGEFLSALLEVSGQGHAVHYATAAALIFRYYGIPSRYVEGYALPPSLFFGVEDGETVALTGEHSHAWVEYYRDGVGWIPFEVTPPYLFIMELPDEVRSYVSDTMDADSAQSGMINMEEDNFEEEEEKPEKDKKEKNSIPFGVVLIISFGLLIVVVSVLQVWLIIRRRKALAMRMAHIEAADESIATDLLFADALEILFAAGLERKNVSLREYELPIKDLCDEGLSALFSMMIPLHREAVFSNHKISAHRRKVFAMFREKAVALAKERSSFTKSWRDRYIRHIY